VALFDWVTNPYALQNVALAAMLAIGVQISLRTGSFSLAAIGFYGIGAYTAAHLVKSGQSTVLAILAGIAISVVVAWLLARLLLRLRDLYLAMATLAFDLLVGVVALNWTSVTGGPLGIYAIPSTVSTTTIVVLLVVVIAVAAALELGVGGRASVVVREDDQLAQSLGIDPDRYRRFGFVLSAAVGALAGALYALCNFAINPGIVGFDAVIATLAMVIVGGYTSWFGALIGSILLVQLPLQLSGIGTWWPAVYGAALLFIAVYAPGGIVGLVGKLIDLGRRALAHPEASGQGAT
jgi:branched-chain amino acid transport system permease protein